MHQTYQHISLLNVGVFVLFISFVGHLFTIPGATLKHRDLCQGCLPMLSPPGTTIYVAPSSPMLHRPSTSLYPYFLPRPMCLCRLSIRFCNLLELSDVLHPRVPFVTLSSARKVPRTNNRQSIKIMGVISQRNGKHT